MAAQLPDEVLMNLSVNSGMPDYVRSAIQTPYEKQVETDARERMGIEDPSPIAKKKEADPTKDPDSPLYECQSCKNRKYQDGSDEMVSFKSAAHIAPSAAGAVVRGHEQEHVSNAYKKAATNNGKVVQCSVAIHTAVCPECGRTYVSGGTTTTHIKYHDDNNQYQKDRKLQCDSVLPGKKVDEQC